MPTDPLRPEASGNLSNETAAPPQPTDSDVVKALVEIEQATATTPAPPPGIPVPTEPPSWITRHAVAAFLVALVGVSVLLAWGLQVAGRKIAASFTTRAHASRGTALARTTDPAMQAEAERSLARLANGDSSAMEDVSSQSAAWTGKTQRTPQSDQLITSALNSREMRAREAAIEVQLALDGVPKNEAGLNILKRAVGNPNQRAWALWMLGALGNRGVDPVHTTKIIGSYLSDHDVQVRANAVNGLALVATDETVPMLLDRFRNDPSPVVQEAAACALAESGMYTHVQRMAAAANLVSWLDDSLLTAAQRGWAVQALRDISGQNVGADSAAWRQWYDSAR
jgi:hypothetical protein